VASSSALFPSARHPHALRRRVHRRPSDSRVATPCEAPTIVAAAIAARRPPSRAATFCVLLCSFLPGLRFQLGSERRILAENFALTSDVERRGRRVEHVAANARPMQVAAADLAHAAAVSLGGVVVVLVSGQLADVHSWQLLIWWPPPAPGIEVP
jgi:hypothetical protein